MFKANRTLFIIALIALVNMLGYGVVIPLLYGYSRKYGLNDFQNGLLFSIFSICQFISTPIIGRLSDKYGRRPLLLISIIGTAGSFILMAFAQSAVFLFLARALDGLTAGNIPVAMAVVSDSTAPKDRARSFGLISAAFNFGFIFGPAVAALTVSISPRLPFLIAAAITIVAVVLTALFLPETNVEKKELSQAKFIDLKSLWRTLFDPNVGLTLFISMLFYLAFACGVIYGFQPYTINVLHLTQSQNAQLFILFGLVGLITQTFIVGRYTKALGVKRGFNLALLLTALDFLGLFVFRSLPAFILILAFIGMANSLAQTLIPTILSEETDPKSQGSIMGLNAAYTSIGLAIGPILGGLIATRAIPFTFLTASIIVSICYLLSFKVLKPNLKPESAFVTD